MNETKKKTEFKDYNTIRLQKTVKMNTLEQSWIKWELF